MDIGTTKPNAGRIYDYMLGGHHNFEVDRLAAEQLNQLAPQVRQWMYLNRWFLHHAIESLVTAGFNHYLDLATGLPTQGYLHERVPETARIMYNDIDPATVAYAQQVLQGRFNVRYVQGDLRNIEPILAEAEAFFEADHRVGIFMVGIAYFLDDESVARVLQRLYDWAAPGSRLAISFITVESHPDAANRVMSFYHQLNMPLYPRTRAEIAPLLGPWQPVGEGLTDLTTYIAKDIQSPLHINQTAYQEAMAGGIFEKLRA
jgi:O-methyltransferase involved in polyketide biosynthesis